MTLAPGLGAWGVATGAMDMVGACWVLTVLAALPPRFGATWAWGAIAAFGVWGLPPLTALAIPSHVPPAPPVGELGVEVLATDGDVEVIEVLLGAGITDTGIRLEATLVTLALTARAGA